MITDAMITTFVRESTVQFLFIPGNPSEIYER
jgi:hypothetical protein